MNLIAAIISNNLWFQCLWKPIRQYSDHNSLDCQHGTPLSENSSDSFLYWMAFVEFVPSTVKFTHCRNIAYLIALVAYQSQIFAVEIILDRIEQFGPTEDADLSGLKVRKVGGERKLFGKWIYHRSFDDSYIAKATAYKKTGAGWNLMP